MEQSFRSLASWQVKPLGWAVLCRSSNVISQAIAWRYYLALSTMRSHVLSVPKLCLFAVCNWPFAFGAQCQL